MNYDNYSEVVKKILEELELEVKNSLIKLGNFMVMGIHIELGENEEFPELLSEIMK